MPHTPSVTPALTLIKKSWGEFKPLWSKFVLLQLIPLIPALGILVLGIITVVVVGTTSTAVEASFTGAWPLWGKIVILTIVVLGGITVVFASFLTSIAQFYLARDRDPKPGVWERFWGAKEKFWGYVWVGFLVLVSIYVGLFLLIVPGIILSVMFTFALFGYLFEGQKGVAALRASRELVRGFWWTVFARFSVYLVLMLLVLIPAYIPIIGFFWQLVLQFVIGPISMLFAFHLWEELRVLKKRSAAANDGMTGGKKFGLGVVMALPSLFIALVITGAVFLALK